MTLASDEPDDLEKRRPDAIDPVINSNAPETGFASFGRDGRLVEANAGMFGSGTRSVSGLIGQPEDTVLVKILERFSELPDFPHGVPDRLARALSAWKTPAAAIDARCSDGKWAMLSNIPRSDGGRTYLAIDISKKVRAAAGKEAHYTGGTAEARARDLLNDAIDSLTEGFALFDVDGTLIMRNKAYRALMGALDNYVRPGRTIEEITSETARTGFYKAAVGRERAFVSEALSHGGALAFEYELERHDGAWLSHSIHPTTLGGGVLTITDITDRKCSEQRAREMLNDAMQSIDDGFALYDADLRYVMSNRKFIDMVHAGEVELQSGRCMIDVLRDLARSGAFVIPDWMTVDDWASKVVVQVRDYSKNLKLTRTDGRFYFGSSHRTELGGYLITVREVTDQRRAEQAEREADGLLRTIVEACPANFMVSRVDDGHIIYCPPASRERFGGIETTLSFFLDPQDRAVYLNHLLPTGVLDDYPVRFRRADGSIMDGLTSARVIQYQGEDVIVSSTRDVTEQLAMQAELARQREISHQNEKLSALGELLAGVAHELNNPLSIVSGYALMLQDKVEEPVMKRRVERIAQAAERCAKIVKTFLAMARQRPARIEDCSLNEVVEIAFDVAGYGVRAAGVTTKLDLDPSLPPVVGDPDQLAQVFTNLIVNAEHALSDKGQKGLLTLRTFYDRASGESVAEVRDNGDGVASELQARIFEPFFTTKDVGTGTGVGLAFCHRIIVSHGGTLSLRSSPGSGASFFVRLKTIGLPKRAAIADAERGHETKQAAPCEGRPRRILVVDDETGVTELFKDLLEDAGYEVATRNDAAEALELLDTQCFDVILSDIKMPGIDGMDFLKAIETAKASYVDRIAFVTGDSMSPQVADFLKRAGKHHVEKPVASSELIDVIERVCASAEGGRE